MKAYNVEAVRRQFENVRGTLVYLDQFRNLTNHAHEDRDAALLDLAFIEALVVEMLARLGGHPAAWAYCVRPDDLDERAGTPSESL